MTEENETPAPPMPFDVFPSKYFKLDMVSGKSEVDLTVKTWGEQFANKPIVLVLTKEVAADLLRRLQKAVDGLV